VILYSAVVSRHHVELRRVGSNWEIVNLGTNGTYVDGKRITQIPATDGSIIRLARSGPNIKIRLGMDVLEEVPDDLASDRTQVQRTDIPQYPTEITGDEQHDDADIDDEAELASDISNTSAIATTTVNRTATSPSRLGIIPVPPHLQLPADSRFEADVSVPAAMPDRAIALASKLTRPSLVDSVESRSECSHSRKGELFCVDCGQPLQVLQTVGGYQLVQVLGRGEMGITYRAWRAGEHFALKMLNASWAENSEAREALECEAETLRQLNHAQIPQATDFFLINQQPYLVMQWMPGLSLSHYVSATGAVPLAEAIAWMLQICSVLDYLHTFTPPLLHRGIKPAALLCQPGFGTNGRIALVDFGAIKSVVLGQKIPPGSTGYAAPEQMELYAIPATDLYALAPTLAFLLTGQNPVSFYADSGDGHRFCAQSVPGIPAALVDVMHTLTHPRPEDRYQSAQAVATALTTIQQVK